MGSVFSNLNLNGRTGARAQPKVGAWGPDAVPSTLRKKVGRILAWVGVVVAAGILITFAVVTYLSFFKIK